MAVHRIIGRLAVLLVTLTALSLSRPPTILADEPPSIPEGEWRGVMASTGAFASSGITGASSFTGNINLTSAAGEVTGEWVSSGEGMLAGEGVAGTATYISSGTVSGSSAHPLIHAEGMHISGTMVVGGSSRPLNMDMPPSDYSEMRFTQVTCSQVIMEWTATAEGFTGSGTMVLTRVGDVRPEDEPDYEELVTDLIVDAHAWEAQVRSTGNLDSDQLSSLLERAENLYNALKRRTDCGASDSGYANLISETIRGLLQFVLDAVGRSDAFSDIDLLSLTNAAARTGVIGENAIWAGADAMEDSLSEAWNSRMDSAISRGDSIGVAAAIAAAAVLGDQDLLERGEAALAELRD